MFRCIWDRETGGVKLVNLKSEETLSVSPRPVFYEELDLLGLDAMGWKYPRSKEPLMWACNKQYFYRGELMFEAKGANIYDKAQVVMKTEKKEVEIEPVDVEEMLRRCGDEMFLIESEAIEFIRDTHQTYSAIKKIREKAESNKVDLEELRKRLEKKRKREMAIVKEDCDSFDIMPLEEAENEGKKVLQTTAKIDVFLASFSGGKDSQVVLDLCTRALMPTDFQVIYSDTGYELPPSLELYEEVKRHYGKLYPELLFRTAKNHAPVLEYWDKIGTPSDTHRWCCSVMKTAPLYRMLKVEGTNKQARVVAFEGTRGEESVRRALYNRIGKGVKHNSVINARPIYSWSTTEVFMYLLKYNLPINKAYRLGKPRVGCVICPFSSEWDDMIVRKNYDEVLKPFVERIENFAKERGIPNLKEYIQDHKWKTRASAKYMNVDHYVVFDKERTIVRGTATNPKMQLETWIPVLGECVVTKTGRDTVGEFKHKGNVFSFRIEQDVENNSYKFDFGDLKDIVFAGMVKRAIQKAVFCINCEVCEVECPTGALSVYPTISINKSQCVHCLKCLTFHSNGCIVADSLNMAQGETKLTGISGYTTFGLREEWLDEYLNSKDSFWEHNALGKKQIPSLRAWLKDCGVVDTKGKITELGEILSKIKDEDRVLLWEVIWINLVQSSVLVRWFNSNVHINDVYSKSSLKEIYIEQYKEESSTFNYALDALYNLFATTPIGKEFGVKTVIDKLNSARKDYQDMSETAVAYSLYKMAEKSGQYAIRVSDLYAGDVENGPFFEFGINRDNLERRLRSLNSMTNRIIVAELNMGLEHITLREGMSALEALKIMTNK